MINADSLSRSDLRKALRQSRRALSPLQQKLASQHLSRQLSTHPWFIHAKTIAFYLANDGEMNTEALFEKARAMKKRCYLPVLHPIHPRLMWFAEYRTGDQLIHNRFGIPEPNHKIRNTIMPWALDLVCMPLVGFDEQGGRLGMGGGFYDRTFAYRLEHPAKRPRLLGIAHECQKVINLTVNDWDIPMDGVATDTAVYECSN